MMNYFGVFHFLNENPTVIWILHYIYSEMPSRTNANYRNYFPKIAV